MMIFYGSTDFPTFFFFFFSIALTPLTPLVVYTKCYRQCFVNDSYCDY